MLTDYQLRETHGVAMATTWGGCALAGAFVARYCRHYPWWIHVHRGFVALGAFMTLPLTFLAYYSHLDEHYGTYHGKLGISVASLSIGQGILGTLLYGKLGFGPCTRDLPACCNLEGRERVNRRKYVARTHRFIGWVAVLLALTTIFFGIWAFSCETQCHLISDLTFVYFGYIAALMVPLICLEVRHQRIKRNIIRIQVPSTPTGSIDGLQPLMGSFGSFVASVEGPEERRD